VNRGAILWAVLAILIVADALLICGLTYQFIRESADGRMGQVSHRHLPGSLATRPL
jgi:hypothetical protein